MRNPIQKAALDAYYHRLEAELKDCFTGQGGNKGSFRDWLARTAQDDTATMRDAAWDLLARRDPVVMAAIIVAANADQAVGRVLEQLNRLTPEVRNVVVQSVNAR